MDLRLDEIGFGALRLLQCPEEFCYGTDAVLLAGYAAEAARKQKQDCRIMDLGTGTGIVPLILSHKTDAGYIAGLELQEHSYMLACRNAILNQLTDRIRFFHGDVNGFCPQELCGTFDLVTANPPYIKGNCGLESRNRAKAAARQETSGSLEDFICCAARLLKDKGEFFIVHRPSRLVDLCESCRAFRLEPKEMLFVSGKPETAPNILLMRCVKNGKRQLRIAQPLYVHNEDGSYSERILKIYEKTS